MQEKRILGTIEYRRVLENGDVQYQTYDQSINYDPERSIQSYIQDFEKDTLAATDSKFVKVITLKITKHDDEGEYELTQNGNLVYETIYPVE